MISCDYFTIIPAQTCALLCEKYLSKNKLSWYSTQSKIRKVNDIKNLLILSKKRSKAPVRLTFEEFELLRKL